MKIASKILKNYVIFIYGNKFAIFNLIKFDFISLHRDNILINKGFNW